MKFAEVNTNLRMIFHLPLSQLTKFDPQLILSPISPMKINVIYTRIFLNEISQEVVINFNWNEHFPGSRGYHINGYS